MSIVSLVFVYLIAWWLIFFAALPFGVRGHREAGEEVPRGSEAAAPVDPKLLPKALVTTGLAAVATAIFWAIQSLHVLDRMIKP